MRSHDKETRFERVSSRTISGTSAIRHPQQDGGMADIGLPLGWERAPAGQLLPLEVRANVRERGEWESWATAKRATRRQLAFKGLDGHGAIQGRAISRDVKRITPAGGAVNLQGIGGHAPALRTAELNPLKHNALHRLRGWGSGLTV